MCCLLRYTVAVLNSKRGQQQPATSRHLTPNVKAILLNLTSILSRLLHNLLLTVQVSRSVAPSNVIRYRLCYRLWHLKVHRYVVQETRVLAAVSGFFRACCGAAGEICMFCLPCRLLHAQLILPASSLSMMSGVCRLTESRWQDLRQRPPAPRKDRGRACCAASTAFRGNSGFEPRGGSGSQCCWTGNQTVRVVVRLGARYGGAGCSAKLRHPSSP